MIQVGKVEKPPKDKSWESLGTTLAALVLQHVARIIGLGFDCLQQVKIAASQCGNNNIETGRTVISITPKSSQDSESVR